MFDPEKFKLQLAKQFESAAGRAVTIGGINEWERLANTLVDGVIQLAQEEVRAALTVRSS